MWTHNTNAEIAIIDKILDVLKLEPDTKWTASFDCNRGLKDLLQNKELNIECTSSSNRSGYF